MEYIKKQLKACDKETVQFLKPIIHLNPVQTLLATFENDTSESFQEWVWDPQVQSRLLQLKYSKMEPSMLNTSFHKHLENNDGREMVSKDLVEDQLKDLLVQVEEGQLKAKQKYEKRNYYAAIREYERNIERLNEMDNIANGRKDVVFETMKMAVEYRYKVNCNIAVAALQDRKPELAERYAKLGMELDKKSVKATYSLAKAYMLQHRFEEARNLVTGFHTKEKALSNLMLKIDMTEEMVQNRTFAPPLSEENTTYRVYKTYEKKHVPLPKKDLPPDLILQAMNKYVSQSKIKCEIQFSTKHDEGNHPIEFGCSYRLEDGAIECTKYGSSRKKAQIAAVEACIEALWAARILENKLLPEDLNATEREEEPHPEVEYAPLKDLLPIVISNKVREMHQVQQLNVLKDVKYHRLSLEWKMQDLTVPLGDDFQFIGDLYINGEHVAQSRCYSKKKCKVSTAITALKILSEPYPADGFHVTLVDEVSST